MKNNFQTNTNKEILLPKYIYRYYSFPDKDCIKRVSEIFVERKLFFPSPAKFNDPFDCKALSLGFNGSPEELKEYLRGQAERLHPDWESNKKTTLVDERMRNGAYEALKGDFFTNVLKERAEQHGVLCLSKAPDNLLMWSHYTNGHKGFCLQFLHADPFFMRAQKVKYSDEYPTVNVMVSDPEQTEFENMLITKTKCWEYEQEWRLLEIGGANKHFIFPEGSLTGVFLGCQMDQHHKFFLSSLIANMSNPPNLFQARLKNNKFGIEFRPMSVSINEKTIIQPVFDSIDP